MKKILALLFFFVCGFLLLNLFLPTFGSTLHPELKGPIRERLAAFMDKKAEEIQFNGTILVGENGKVIFQKGYGYSDLDQGSFDQTDTEYRIASLTKSFTAISVLQLESAGKLKTSDSISKFFPDYKYGNKITIHDLLTHSSGIKDHFQLTDTAKPITTTELIRLMGKQNLLFTPGSRFQYSNTGYTILAGVIEKVSGEPYGTYVRDHILRIAGMNHSYFTEADAQKLAIGYQKMKKAEMKDDESQLKGAGDIISTVGDLLKYNNAIQTNLLLPPDEKMKMETGYIDIARWGVFKYGYGWEIANNFISFGTHMIEHNGSLPGYKSELTHFPDADLTVIVLSNNNGTWNSGALSRELASICLGKRFLFFQKYY